MENVINIIKNLNPNFKIGFDRIKFIYEYIVDFTGEAPNIKSLFLIGASSSNNVEMDKWIWMIQAQLLIQSFQSSLVK